jgi:hypothetical protein
MRSTNTSSERKHPERGGGNGKCEPAGVEGV